VSEELVGWLARGFCWREGGREGGGGGVGEIVLYMRVPFVVEVFIFSVERF